MKKFDECMTKFTDMKTSFHRRNKNNKERVKMCLEFLDGQTVIYDKTIFLRDNDHDSELLQRKGFVQEQNTIFDLSTHTMFWEKYMIEIEIVSPANWRDLKKCIDIAELTSYFNINNILKTLTKE